MRAEEWLRQRNLEEALRELENQVRQEPANPKLRIFLFQLLAVMGQWDRASTQLDAAAQLDQGNLLLAAMYRPALQARQERDEVLAGKRTPTVVGEPQEWMAWMIQALQLQAEGRCRQAAELRSQAFEAAPAVPGTVNDVPFEWLADADGRFGPILEAIINGRYCWVPFQRLRELRVEAPEDLRDMVWATAHVIWENGGEAMAFIPTRYANSESSPDASVRLARKTEWVNQGEECYVGLGQRILVTDAGEYPLLDVRRIVMGAGPPGGAEEAAHA